MPQQIKIFNGKIITPRTIIDRGTILVNGETIAAIQEGDIETDNAIEIDAKGQYISPGFIDIHVHGGGGHDGKLVDTNESLDDLGWTTGKTCPPAGHGVVLGETSQKNSARAHAR